MSEYSTRIATAELPSRFQDFKVEFNESVDGFIKYVLYTDVKSKLIFAPQDGHSILCKYQFSHDSGTVPEGVGKIRGCLSQHVRHWKKEKVTLCSHAIKSVPEYVQ